MDGKSREITRHSFTSRGQRERKKGLIVVGKESSMVDPVLPYNPSRAKLPNNSICPKFSLHAHFNSWENRLSQLKFHRGGTL